MPRSFVHLSYLFFALVAVSGVWMRAFPFAPVSFVPYPHVLHAHSHFALLGWAFFGCFILFLRIYGPRVRQKRQATVAASALVGISLAMLIAFLYQGYGPISIAASTLHIFVEYWIAFIIYRTIRQNPSFSEIGARFIYGSLVALVLSSVGPYSLAYIAARGLKETAWYDMAIYFYLHFQYNGWLLLFLIGTFVLLLRRREIPLDERKLKIGFWMYLIALFPGYFHSILWAEPGPVAEGLAAAAGVAQLLAVVLLLGSFKEGWRSLQRHYPRLITAGLFLTMLVLGIKSLLELGLLVPALAERIYESRSVVIGYLHLVLLGFVSLFILLQYGMAGIWRVDRRIGYGMIVFYGGFLLTEVLLFLQGLAEWTGAPQIPYTPEGLLLASLMLLFGIVLMWWSFARGGTED